MTEMSPLGTYAPKAKHVGQPPDDGSCGQAEAGPGDLPAST